MLFWGASAAFPKGYYKPDKGMPAPPQSQAYSPSQGRRGRFSQAHPDRQYADGHLRRRLRKPAKLPGLFCL
jgi:hypothetical protein